MSRKGGNIIDKSEVFRTRYATTVNAQFAQLYYQRLTVLKPRMLSVVEATWGHKYRVCTVSDVVENETVCLIGTLYKEMELKPNILREMHEDFEIHGQIVLQRYTSDTDTLYIEDESQRIIVVGKKLDLPMVVTGVIAALIGWKNGTGAFVVEDYRFLGMPPQPHFDLPESDCYLAFFSGLGLGRSNTSTFPVDSCIDLLAGRTGDEKQRQKMACVAAVIIAGDLIEVDLEERQKLSVKTRHLSRHKSLEGSVEKMQNVDATLASLVRHVDVYIMPGSKDPANLLLPQQPLHVSMFPLCNKSAGLHLVTNPFRFDLQCIRVLGTSGQNVSDIYKNCRTNDPLDILEQTLHWGHMAPTAPDTLGCYPFVEIILISVKHICLCGCHKIPTTLPLCVFLCPPQKSH
ncbi:DNA polymerase delta subunit 2-like isoform X2 [Paramacrobiotus metropolitanus]|uniref:DNA polymerase delta subunit 2-like isoform X2 n=1 Tax=Paramacrobiotus metropolitanus TaxID=2943436 RepID=UPI0024457331|nr:DNA polymerase delta subunit 2-like isoform X2 [Paramacrobiotus metropolitanus]